MVVSIIIPTRDRSSTLDKFLDCLLPQIKEVKCECEVIACDDGRTDETHQMLAARYPGV